MKNPIAASIDIICFMISRATATCLDFKVYKETLARGDLLSSPFFGGDLTRIGGGGGGFIRPQINRQAGLQPFSGVIEWILAR